MVKYNAIFCCCFVCEIFFGGQLTVRFLFVRLLFALSALSELPSAATKGCARVRTVTAGLHHCAAPSAAAFLARRAEHITEKRSLKSWDTDMA